ncbi:peptidylprolyl isomerase [Oceanobacillus halophilus]|uniref:peptidylprolyl isomerase n=1 Tax=Oceanobacillus halophilus TaxID=930130 RepID=A0A495A1Z4_9BACI|nr:peptidylprolyl isomerase [Oceanobacillus halophilus]RKQ33045.1 protein secretion protein [Oceanobacillus halophilus]
MSKRFLLSVVVVLLITNIATLLIFSRDDKVVLQNGDIEVSSNDAVATVSGKEIEYGAWVNALMDSYGKKKLQTMIDKEVVRQLADVHEIEIDKKVIEREISFLASMQGVMTEKEFNELEEGWVNDIQYRYQLEKLLTKDITVPQSEVRQFYNTYGDQYNFTESMQLSHILVDDFKTAEKIKQELDDGASFPLLAKEYSLDEETKDDGGYLGFIHTNSQFFPTGYKEVAEELDEHTYSEPFSATDKVALIYVHRKLPSIEFSYDEISPYIESELAMQEVNQSLSAAPLWKEIDINWIYGD